MDINAINKQHAESKKVQNRISQWDDKEKPLAKLASLQIDLINEIEELNTKAKSVKLKIFVVSRDVLKLLYLLDFRMMHQMNITMITHQINI